MRSLILLIVTLLTTALAPAVSAEQFKDVPEDHWAAEYVQRVADAGVMKGYPDASYKGNKAVTRYELAVALERMISYIEGSLKPEVEKQKPSPLPQPSPVKGKGASAPSLQPLPPGERVANSHAKIEGKDPAQRLKTGGYIAADSPLLKDKDHTVSSTELSEALASVAAKLIDKHVPAAKE